MPSKYLSRRAPTQIRATAIRSAPHTYTATGTGASPAVDLPTTYGRPMDRFALQVKGTNTQVGITTWTVVVEVSLDGTTYTTVATHAYPATADGVTVWAADAILRPANYMRVNVNAVTLGTATNIICTLLGMP